MFLAKISDKKISDKIQALLSLPIHIFFH